jgi:hypothetical protein
MQLAAPSAQLCLSLRQGLERRRCRLASAHARMIGYFDLDRLVASMSDRTYYRSVMNLSYGRICKHHSGCVSMPKSFLEKTVIRFQ